MCARAYASLSLCSSHHGNNLTQRRWTNTRHRPSHLGKNSIPFASATTTSDQHSCMLKEKVWLVHWKMCPIFLCLPDCFHIPANLFSSPSILNPCRYRVPCVVASACFDFCHYLFVSFIWLLALVINCCLSFWTGTVLGSSSFFVSSTRRFSTLQLTRPLMMEPWRSLISSFLLYHYCLPFFLSVDFLQSQLCAFSLSIPSFLLRAQHPNNNKEVVYRKKNQHDSQGQETMIRREEEEERSTKRERRNTRTLSLSTVRRKRERANGNNVGAESTALKRHNH